MSLTLKFSFFTSCLSLLIIAGVSFLSYQNSYSEFETSLGQRLEAIATTGAINIDGALHDQIKTEEDVQTPAFIEIRDHLRGIKDANNLKEELYTFRRVNEELEFVVMSHDKPFIGHTYSIRPEMLPTLSEGQPAHTGVYTDVHGSWISAYAPIFDSNNHVSGLLEVDIRVEEFLELTRKHAVTLISKSLVIALIAVVLSFALAKTVTRRITYLTDITEKISLGKIDMPINITGKDEVAKLGKALDRMRESIKIAAELMD